MKSLRLLVILTALGGCSTTLPRPPGGRPGLDAEFNAPPRQMVETVRQVVTSPPLSLPIESENKGVIVTGFGSFPGEWHVARRWQERTRYEITIIPDWDEPTARCRVMVIEQTEQRAAEGQSWDPAPELDRRDRAADVLRRIEQAAKSKTP